MSEFVAQVITYNFTAAGEASSVLRLSGKAGVLQEGGQSFTLAISLSAFTGAIVLERSRSGRNAFSPVAVFTGDQSATTFYSRARLDYDYRVRSSSDFVGSCTATITEVDDVQRELPKPDKQAYLIIRDSGIELPVGQDIILTSPSQILLDGVPYGPKLYDDNASPQPGYTAPVALGANSVVIGEGATDGVGSDNSVVFGTSATVGAGTFDAIAIGSGSSVAAAMASALAIGNTASALQSGATAVGAGASAGDQATALGNSANASGLQSTALGTSANAAAANATAVGDNLVVTAARGVAVGYLTNVSGTDGVAVGTGANATAADAVAVGNAATASGISGIAIGLNAVAPALDSIMVGNGGSAASTGSIAIGQSATVTGFGLGNNSIAIGTTAAAADAAATAVGNAAAANGLNSVSVGNSSIAGGASAVAVGNNASATGLEAVAIGETASAPGAQQVVIGSDAVLHANLTGAIAIGDGAGSAFGTSAQCISIGQTAAATGEDAVAIGASASAANWGSVAIGAGANANQTKGVAIGPDASAENSGVAIGNLVDVNGTETIGIGEQATVGTGNIGGIAIGGGSGPGSIVHADADYAIAIGYNASCNNTNSSFAIAMGVQSSSTAQSAVAIGYGATGSGTDAVAVGETSTAAAAQSVAIGSDVVIGADATASIVMGDGANVNNGNAAIRCIVAGWAASSGGARSIVLGNACSASAGSVDCVVAGSSATAADDYAIVIGMAAGVGAGSTNGIAIGQSAGGTGGANMIGIGQQCGSNQPYTIAMGYGVAPAQANENRYGWSMGIAQPGGFTKIAQSFEVLMVENTTDATPVNLVDGAGNRLTVPASTAWLFEVDVIAVRATTQEVGAYTFRGGVIERDGAGNTTLRAAPAKTVLYETDAAYDVAITADDVNEALQIQVTGVAAKTINWLARVRVLPLTSA